MCVCVHACKCAQAWATSGASSFYMFGTALSHLRLRSTPRGRFDAAALFTVIPSQSPWERKPREEREGERGG